MQNIRKVLLFSILISCFFACNNDKAAIEETIVKEGLQWPDWATNGNIYEVNIRQYTPEGTFNAFGSHLPRLSKMGVKILWLMPIFPISETKRKGGLGSYYAVSDFRATNPEFGTMADFDAMITKAHNLGMKVILDWVPNHTGWDHTWIDEHPEYYTKDSTGNITDPINSETGESWGWTDVADLNYDNNEMRAQMLEDLKFWVADHNIDGYRYDVSHGVPLDFWEMVNPSLLNVNPDLFFLSESEILDHTNMQLFHAIYGWEFHHMINDIAKGEKDVSAIDEWLAKRDSTLTNGVYMQFTSNHDENSWAGTTRERMGEGANAFAVLTATLDGIPLIYGGQEEPLDKRLEFFEKDDIGFADFRNEDFYTRLLKLKRESKALSSGGGLNPNFRKIVSSDKVYGFVKSRDGEKVVVIINLSDEPAEVVIEDDIKNMTNLMTGGPVEVPKGTSKIFEPWEYVIASTPL